MKEIGSQSNLVPFSAMEKVLQSLKAIPLLLMIMQFSPPSSQGAKELGKFNYQFFFGHSFQFKVANKKCKIILDIYASELFSGTKNIYFEQLLFLYFLVKHSRSCSPKKIVPPSHRDVVPLFPWITWLRLPFSILPKESPFLSRSCNLKKTAQKHFFLIHFVHGRERKEKKKGLIRSPFDQKGRF